MNDSTVVLPPGFNREWAQPKLGQTIILIELIARVKAVSRISKDFFVSPKPAYFSPVLNPMVTALQRPRYGYIPVFQYARSEFRCAIRSKGRLETFQLRGIIHLHYSGTDYSATTFHALALYGLVHRNQTPYTIRKTVCSFLPLQLKIKKLCAAQLGCNLRSVGCYSRVLGL